MEVKSGYKRTEVGVIPEDWRVRKLASLADKIMVGIASAATHAYRTKGIPLLRNQNIKSGYLDERDVLFIAPEYEALFRNKRLRVGDLLTARTGYPGMTCVVPARYEAAQSFTTLITRPKTMEVDSAYLCHFINAEEGQRFFNQSQIGGAQKNVNAGALREMPIPVPPFPEQRAIAEVLGDVDALLGSLEQLITKKRDLKQAAMQQLLIGKKRLPGFSGGWEVKKLGDVGSFSKGKGIKKDEVVADGLACVRYGEIYTHHHDYLKVFNSFITSTTARQSQLIQKGDLLFAGSGETAEEIGKCIAFLGDEEAYAGGDIVIFRPIDQDSKFLGYLMNHSSVASQKACMGQGDAVVHISARNLARLELDLPAHGEQTAIAEVLSDMDAELAALEQRLAKTRDLKQGMMQELLTGRTRLV